jgi:RNA recognition motif-containing protein
VSSNNTDYSPKYEVSNQGNGETMGVRLFVGNLSFSLGDGDLHEAFAEIGGVERAEIVRDRFDGRSRGFGFVEMKTQDDATVAVRAMNGKELAGRPLRVEAATSQRRPFDRSAMRA